MGTFQTSSRQEKCDVCVASAYCNETGQSKAKDCPKGFYCPYHTISPIPCPVGHYRGDIKGTNLTSCVLCKEGQYCRETGLAEPSGDCYAGYYCRLGSSVPNPVSFLSCIF